MKQVVITLFIFINSFILLGQCPISFTCNNLQLNCYNSTSQIQLTASTSSVACVWYGPGIVSGDSTLSPTVNLPGVYNFTLTDLSNGCITQSITTVSQNTTTPTLSVSSSSMVLTCTASSVNLSCTSSPSISIVWSGGSLANAPNPASTNYAGSYTATATNTISGCTSTAVVNVINNISTTQPTIAVNSGTICSGSASISLNATGATTFVWTPTIGLNSSTGSSIVASPSIITIYTVTGSVGSCTSIATTTVTVNQSPSVSFSLTPNANTLHVWDVTPTYSGGTLPYTYQWNWGDGSPISNVPYPSHTYTTAGWYNLCTIITDANGCSSTNCRNDSLYRINSSNIMVTVNVIDGLTTDVNKSININNIFSIFPNPAKDLLNITVGILKENTEIELYNAIGEIVLKENITTQNSSIKIDHLQSGIFFYKVLVNNKVIKTNKLIVIR